MLTQKCSSSQILHISDYGSCTRRSKPLFLTMYDNAKYVPCSAHHLKRQSFCSYKLKHDNLGNKILLLNVLNVCSISKFQITLYTQFVVQVGIMTTGLN